MSHNVAVQGAAVASADASFPVLLLSHGVGGTRTASSIISGTLASQVQPVPLIILFLSSVCS